MFFEMLNSFAGGNYKNLSAHAFVFIVTNHKCPLPLLYGYSCFMPRTDGAVLPSTVKALMAEWPRAGFASSSDASDTHH